MPKLLNQTDAETGTTLHNFQYSHVSIDKLLASEYTIVQLTIDKSSSVYAFKTELEKTIGMVLEACKKSPRVENLLLRVVTFSTQGSQASIEEIHGFQLLKSISPDQYVGCINPCGMTPLNDASLDSLESMEELGKTLNKNNYKVNAVGYLITDGAENSSKNSMQNVKKQLSAMRKSEVLESVKLVLIGVNDSECKTELELYKKETGIDQYISINEVTPKKLGQLAAFISESISSTSTNLGNPGSNQVNTSTLPSLSL